MRALRERPRVTVAKGLAVVLVFLLGVGFASAMSDDEPNVPPATARALERAETAAGASSDRLAEAEAEVRRLERRVTTLERRVRAREATNRRLRRALRSARRELAEPNAP